MAGVDVTAEIDIGAAPADVAAVMFDPQREPEWVKAVSRVELLDAELRPGARVERHGTLFGREMTWVTEVESVHFPHALSLTIVQGPFLGTLRYDIQRSATGSRARIRSAGDAIHYGPLPSAMIAAT